MSKSTNQSVNDSAVTTVNSTSSSNATDSGVSIEFMGKNITSKGGLYAYKLSIIILPLIPTFMLIVQTGFEFGPLYSEAIVVNSLDTQVC